MRLISIGLTAFITVFFLLSLTANAQMFGGGFDFPRVDPDHIPANPYVKDYIRVSKCELRSTNKVYQLNEPAKDFKTILDIISLTPTGKKLVTAFQKQEQLTPHNFVLLNSYVRQHHGFPISAAAIYMFNERGRTLFYDPQDDLGLLTIIMSHELAHAVDPEVPPAYFAEVDAYKNKSPEEFKRLLHTNAFRLERRAFDMQDKVLPELLELTECYDNFLNEHRRTNGLKLFLPTPDSFIRESYRLPENATPGLHVHD